MQSTLAPSALKSTVESTVQPDGDEKTPKGVERISTLTASTTALDDEPLSTSLRSIDTNPANDDKAKKSGVSFSTVRVHQHRLTLGDNPGVSVGVPLTLGWEVEDSETYDLQAFERLNNSEGTQANNSVCRYTRAKRELIASENHSRDSIVQRSTEVREIKQSIEKSEMDKIAKYLEREERRKKGLFRWFRR